MSDLSDGTLGSGTVPANEDSGKGPTYRVMLGVVIFLGILIVIAVAVLVAGFIMKMSGSGPRASSGADSAFALPAGAGIETMEVSGNRLILRVRTDAGEEIDIVDIADGRLVGQVKTAAPDIPK